AVIGGPITFLPEGDSKIEFAAAGAGYFNLIGAGAAQVPNGPNGRTAQRHDDCDRCAAQYLLWQLTRWQTSVIVSGKAAPSGRERHSPVPFPNRKSPKHRGDLRLYFGKAC